MYVSATPLQPLILKPQHHLLKSIVQFRMSLLAASVARRSRGSSSSKRILRHASACHDLTKSFSSHDKEEEHSNRHGNNSYHVSYRPSHLNSRLNRFSHSLGTNQTRFASISTVSFGAPFSTRARTSTFPLLLDEGKVVQPISETEMNSMSETRSLDAEMSPRAMRRLIYTSTVRALGTAGGSQSTPFHQTMHRVVHRAYFSTQPESKEGAGSSSTTAPASGAKVSTPPSASFSTSTTSSDEKKQSYAVRAQEAIKSAITSASKALVNFFFKLPGVVWFYLTHPKDLVARLHELKEAAQHEINHYYMGSKLLVADVKTAYSMLKRTLQGSALSRRERKQLLRTVSDLFRLVPFSMFVLIPFMEFALPFALRLFPNMLPSTFQDSLKAEESMKRELKSRIAMAAFFQE
jgi:hypothetical protein